MNFYRVSRLVAVGAICLFSCKWVFIPDTGTTATSVINFKVPNGAISGWTENAGPDSFSVVAGSGGLEGLLDGGAGQYTSAGGFVQAMIQDMVATGSGASGEEIVTYVFQYADSTEAAMTYNDIMSSSSGTIDSIPGYTKSVAFGLYSLSGNVYAHMSNFVFWMAVTGFSNQTQAFQTSSLFLGQYKADIGE
jgi:hypothetical protein